MDLKSMRAVCGAITHVAIKTFFAHVDIEIFVSYRAVTWTKVQETRFKNLNSIWVRDGRGLKITNYVRSL